MLLRDIEAIIAWALPCTFQHRVIDRGGGSALPERRMASLCSLAMVERRLFCLVTGEKNDQHTQHIAMSQDSIQCSQEKAALRMHVFHPSQACKWLSLQHLRFQLQPRHSSRRNASNQSTRCRATKEPVSIEMWLLHQPQVQLVGEVGWAQIFLAPFHV